MHQTKSLCSLGFAASQFTSHWVETYGCLADLLLILEENLDCRVLPSWVAAIRIGHENTLRFARQLLEVVELDAVKEKVLVKRNRFIGDVVAVTQRVKHPLADELVLVSETLQ